MFSRILLYTCLSGALFVSGQAQTYNAQLKIADELIEQIDGIIRQIKNAETKANRLLKKAVDHRDMLQNDPANLSKDEKDKDEILDGIQDDVKDIKSNLEDLKEDFNSFVSKNNKTFGQVAKKTSNNVKKRGDNTLIHESAQESDEGAEDLSDRTLKNESSGQEIDSQYDEDDYEAVNKKEISSKTAAKKTNNKSRKTAAAKTARKSTAKNKSEENEDME